MTKQTPLGNGASVVDVREDIAVGEGMRSLMAEIVKVPPGNVPGPWGKGVLIVQLLAYRNSFFDLLFFCWYE